MKKIFEVALIILFVTIVIIFVVFESRQEVLAKVIMGHYQYFTQEKNLTNLTPNFPIIKGLFNKIEDGIISTGNYSIENEIPNPKDFIGDELVVDMRSDGKLLSIAYTAETPKIKNNIPVSKQFLQESITETNVYIVLPEDVFPKLLSQAIKVSDSKGHSDYLVISNEKTDLSKILKQYNSILKGTQGSQSNYSSKFDRVFDGSLDLMERPKLFEKVFNKIINKGAEESEVNRVQALKEKYREGYNVYKLPFNFRFDKKNHGYFEIGRRSLISFHSQKPAETKIFIEIPRLTFKVDVDGKTIKATLEGLTYELLVEPEYINFNNVQ